MTSVMSRSTLMFFSPLLQSLPKVIKRRLKALKKLQLQFTDMEADFYKEVHALEVRLKGLVFEASFIVPQKVKCIYYNGSKLEDKIVPAGAKSVDKK